MTETGLWLIRHAIVRGQRVRREVEKSVNLGHRTVDSPPRPHLPPVENQLFLNGTQLHFCLYRNYRTKRLRVKPSFLQLEPNNLGLSFAKK